MRLQPDVRFQTSALLALQEAAEDVRPHLNEIAKSLQNGFQYLVSVFEDTISAARHAKRETMCMFLNRPFEFISILLSSQARDMALVLRVRGEKH
jgi:histone H3/H4